MERAQIKGNRNARQGLGESERLKIQRTCLEEQTGVKAPGTPTTMTFLSELGTKRTLESLES